MAMPTGVAQSGTRSAMEWETHMRSPSKTKYSMRLAGIRRMLYGPLITSPAGMALPGLLSAVMDRIML